MGRCAVVLMVLTWPGPAAAPQAGSGSVSGVVMDMRTGTPLSAAGVVLHLNTIDNLAAKGGCSKDCLPHY